jgi:hypothetical protein
MTTIRGGSALGVEPGNLPIHLSRGANPSGLVATGVIRRSRPELPVTAGRHPGRRPSRPVAPHREERCPAWLRHTHLEIIRS